MKRKEMSPEDREFMDVTCREFIMGQSLEDYKKDIARWLTLSDWHYSEEEAKDQVKANGKYILECYLKKESVEYTAIDVGYCCG